MKCNFSIVLFNEHNNSLIFSGNKDFGGNSNPDEDSNYDWILDETPRGKQTAVR